MHRDRILCSTGRYALSRSIFATFATLACLVILGPRANAEVRLPSLIGDNMMLQQRVNVPIWGKASPKEHVMVTIGKQDEPGLQPGKYDRPVGVTIPHGQLAAQSERREQRAGGSKD